MSIQFLDYIANMRSRGKKITQLHIDRLLDTMERAGKDISKNRNGGVCQCGVPYELEKIDNCIGKFKWYIRKCDCDCED